MNHFRRRASAMRTARRAVSGHRHRFARFGGMATLFALAGVAALVACDPGRAAAGSNTTCITFSDCDDGKFCTDDNCVAFFCVHTAHCPDDFNPCTQDCSESQNKCVNHIPEPAETTCGFLNLEHCDGAGHCGPPLSCAVDTDCPSNEVCASGFCTLPTPTRTRTRTPTATRTRTGTATRTPTRTATRTSTHTATGTATRTATRSATQTATASRTQT